MKKIFRQLKPMKVWLWLFTNLPRIICRLLLFSEFIQTQKTYPTSLDNKYPNLKTTCYIKLKYFLWTKLLENLLLAVISHICHCDFNLIFILKMNCKCGLKFKLELARVGNRNSVSKRSMISKKNFSDWNHLQMISFI